MRMNVSCCGQNEQGHFGPDELERFHHLLVFSLHHQGVQTVQALNLLTQRRKPPAPLPPDDRHYQAARDSGLCSRQFAPAAAASWLERSFDLALTALNLLPSIATLASLNSSRRRHSSTNSRQTCGLPRHCSSGS